LLTRKKLARVSKTPGRTRSLNFYDVSGEVYFVDLPGYGYADVPTEEKKAWAPMIETYLRRRRSLAALVCVMDLRRGMEGDDQQLIESAPHFGVQPILVFTKADKFGEQKRARRRREIAEEFGVEVDELLLFSSEERIGQRDLWRRIDERTGAGR
ncbi:MAG: ribosome biogenesis GTP-binding protein YihA/YsxC, partial [Bradymonadaceae bacterium]